MFAFFRISKWFKSKEESPRTELTPENVPRHIAIIMDGNGRWASAQGLPRVIGHRKGVSTVKKTAITADSIGVQYLTLYSFSTENWKRPKSEVDYLMSLPREFLAKELDELMQKNVQIRMIGFRDGLPADTLDAVQEAEEKTKHNTGLVLSFAFNYGSRREMLMAMQQVARDVQTGQLDVEQIDEAMYSRYLLTHPMPDPDLLIRTSGELRISNFLMWQLAYSELYFTDVYWPDFSEEHFLRAVIEYQRRARRYGAL